MYKYVLRIVNVLVRARLNASNDLERSLAPSILFDLRLNEHTLGSRSSRIALGIYRVSSDWQISFSKANYCIASSLADLVEEDVFSVSSLCRKLLEISILINTVLLT